MDGIDILELFNQSSLVIKIVYIVLCVMSLSSWTVIFFKTIQFHACKANAAADLTLVLGCSTLRNLRDRLDEMGDTPAGQAAVQGLGEYSRLIRLELPAEETAQVALDSVRHALREEAETQGEKLSGVLPLLATCSTAAPLLGLFGTVWGIMDSFHGFKGLKTMPLAAVGPGLAEALATTALGLIVAIPATLAYNLLLMRLSEVQRDLTRFNAGFLNLVKRDLALAAKSEQRPKP